MSERDTALRDKILRLPRRREPISGQVFSYVKLDDVLALLAEAERPVQQSSQADGLGSRDTVLCSLIEPDQVCHLEHPECNQEAPHYIDTCGRFLPKRAEAERPAVDCPACGETVQQVSSATLSLALWQHWNWVCRKRLGADPPASPAPAAVAPADRAACPCEECRAWRRKAGL